MQGKLLDRIDRRSRLLSPRPLVPVVVRLVARLKAPRQRLRAPRTRRPVRLAKPSAARLYPASLRETRANCGSTKTVLAKSAGSRSRSPPRRRSGKIQSETQDWCEARGREPSRSPSRGSPPRRTRCRPASQATSRSRPASDLGVGLSARERASERPGLSGRPSADRGGLASAADSSSGSPGSELMGPSPPWNEDTRRAALFQRAAVRIALSSIENGRRR